MCSASSCTSSSSRGSLRFSITIDEVGERRAAASSSGTPSSRLNRRVMPPIVSTSMYSTMSGPMPLATTRGTACITSSSVRNGARTVAWCAGRGYSRSVASVTSASVPSEPMISCVRS